MYRKATKKDIIYYMIWAHGPVTCEEVEQMTGFSHQTVSARISEMHQKLQVAGQQTTSSGTFANTYIIR